MKYNGVVQYEQEYGAFGQIGLLRDIKNGMAYRYEYDTAGRLLRSTGTPTSANGFATLDFTNTYHPTKGWLTAVKRVIDGVARQSTYTYKTNGQLEKETFADGGSVTYYPDVLGRVYSTSYKHNTTTLFDRDVLFADDESGNNTTGRVVNDWLIATDWVDLYTYGYDANGNISTQLRQTSLDESATTSSYYYDALNQLTAANHNGISYAYVYDYGGNITRKVIDGTVTAYTYGDSTWRDLLTGYGNETFTYDQIGNPLTWRNGAVFTWQGRQLQTATVNGKSLSYSYNADGIRTKKVVNGTATYYVLDGSKVVSQKTGTNDPVYFEYDATGKPVSMSYLGMVFYYVTNMQGDVIALVNSAGDKVVEYTYDPWGKLLSTTGLYANDFGYLNPFRYRGYYYDNETGLYYLNSRYYDPEVGRFINADSVISGSGESVQGYNLFAYCLNNPINLDDANGNWPKWVSGVLDIISGLAQVVSGAAVASGASWTGIGLVGGIAMIANGVCTAGAGVGKIINDLANTVILSEENLIKTGCRELGKAVAGETGGMVAASLYDGANFASEIVSITGVGDSLKLQKLAKTGKISTFRMAKSDSFFMDTYRVSGRRSADSLLVTECYVKVPKKWLRVVDGLGWGAGKVNELISLFEEEEPN